MVLYSYWVPVTQYELEVGFELPGSPPAHRRRVVLRGYVACSQIDRPHIGRVRRPACRSSSNVCVYVHGGVDGHGADDALELQVAYLRVLLLRVHVARRVAHEWGAGCWVKKFSRRGASSGASTV